MQPKYRVSASDQQNSQTDCGGWTVFINLFVFSFVRSFIHSYSRNIFQDICTHFLQSRHNSSTFAFAIAANLKLTNNKGAEILSFYREHCPELNDTLANATSLDATYEIIVHWSQNHHGDNLSPHVNASTHGMLMIIMRRQLTPWRPPPPPLSPSIK